MKKHQTKLIPSGEKAIQSNDALTKLFKEQLMDVINTEEKLVSALPKMAKGTTSDELRQAFTNHSEVTKRQEIRLEQILELLGANLLLTYAKP